MWYPLFLQEATIALFPQAPDGNPRRSRPVWVGGVVEGLDMAMSFQTSVRPVTGAPCPVRLSGAEEHRIEMRRLWVQRYEDATEARPSRGRHVLEITWRSAATRIWLRRRYRDCYFESGRWSSNGRYESAFSQVFIAGRMDEGPIGGVGVPDEVLPSAASPLAPLLFVGPGPVHAGTPSSATLLGVYRMAAAAVATRLDVVCLAGAGTVATVLQLHVGGAPVAGATVSIPAGATSAAVVWSGVALSAGQVLTLKAVGGPADVLTVPREVAASLSLESVS